MRVLNVVLGRLLAARSVDGYCVRFVGCWLRFALLVAGCWLQLLITASGLLVTGCWSPVAS